MTAKQILTPHPQFAFLGFQLLGVESFGEAEFWLALIKLIGLVAYFLFSIIYVGGGIEGVRASAPVLARPGRLC